MQHGPNSLLSRPKILLSKDLEKAGEKQVPKRKKKKKKKKNVENRQNRSSIFDRKKAHCQTTNQPTL
jgi:hypothetical protein